MYDILYDIFTDSALFKCGSWQVQMQLVQMQPYLNQMQALLVPCVCLSVLASN